MNLLHALICTVNAAVTSHGEMIRDTQSLTVDFRVACQEDNKSGFRALQPWSYYPKHGTNSSSSITFAFEGVTFPWQTIPAHGLSVPFQGLWQLRCHLSSPNQQKKPWSCLRHHLVSSGWCGVNTIAYSCLIQMKLLLLDDLEKHSLGKTLSYHLITVLLH